MGTQKPDDYCLMLKTVYNDPCEDVYLAIVHPALCLFLYLTCVHFRGKLQHGGDLSQQKTKCRPIRTREIGHVSLSGMLYVIYSEIIFHDILEKQETASCAICE